MKNQSIPSMDEVQKPEHKMFGFSNALGAALLGGLFAAIYVMYKNYLACGMKSSADQVLKIGIPITLLLHFVLFYIMEFTEISVPFGLYILAVAVVGFTQDKIIKEHAAANGEFYGIGRSLLVAVSAMAVSITILAVLIFTFYSRIPDLQTSSGQQISLNAGDGSVWQTYDVDQFSQESDAIQFYKTEDGINWNTYLNSRYLFEISYPETVLVFGRPDNLTEEGQIMVTNTDDRISLGSASDLVHRIVVGVFNTNADNTLEIARSQYINFAIPAQIEQMKQQGIDLDVSDFVIQEIEFKGKQSLEIKSPLVYEILTVNSAGNVVGIRAREYDGGETTEKDRLTKEIINTFAIF